MMDMALTPTLQERTGRVPLLPGIHRALATTMWKRAGKIELFPGMQMALDLTAQTRSIMVGLAPMVYHCPPAVWQQTAKAAGTFFARSPTIGTTRSYYSCFVQLRYAIQYWHVPFLNPFQKGDLFKAMPPAWAMWKSNDHYLSDAFYTKESSASLLAVYK